MGTITSISWEEKNGEVTAYIATDDSPTTISQNTDNDGNTTEQHDPMPSSVTFPVDQIADLNPEEIVAYITSVYLKNPPPVRVPETKLLSFPAPDTVPWRHRKFYRGILDGVATSTDGDTL